MRKQKKLTEKEMNELLKSQFIEKVFKNRIVYTNEFKISALEQYRNGLPPVEIFANAGIDLNLVGRKNAVNLILKWSKEVIKTSKQLSLEQQIEELKAQNAYLKAENDFLKKLS